MTILEFCSIITLLYATFKIGYNLGLKDGESGGSALN